MELLEALKTRKSIRAFKPEAVPRELITRILEAARWSPLLGEYAALGAGGGAGR